MEPLVFMNDIEILKNKGSKYLGLNFDKYVSFIQKIESSQLFLLSRFFGYQNTFHVRLVGLYTHVLKSLDGIVL